jgi:hypothetical protein
VDSLHSSRGRWSRLRFSRFSDPRGIEQAYHSPSYDFCFPPSFVFLPRLMALGSFFKLVLEDSKAILRSPFWTPIPSSVGNFMLRRGVNITALCSFSALHPEGQSITKNFTMMVFGLGYVPTITRSSTDPNGNSYSPQNSTSECLAGTIFPRSIFISSKAFLNRILVELPLSIWIQNILWLSIARLSTKASVCGRDTPA